MNIIKYYNNKYIPKAGAAERTRKKETYLKQTDMDSFKIIGEESWYTAFELLHNHTQGQEKWWQ